MSIGDTEYHAALRKWRELYTVKLAQRLTFEQAVELDSLDKQLTDAEIRHGIANVVNDYEFAIGQAGNLSGVEL